MWPVALGGLVFGVLAGLMAFLITYEEYSHHHLPRRQLWQHALGMAGATCLFFVALAVAIGWALALMLHAS
jgi:hypothetical protein